ncbi:MAG: aminomethyl-transferring glycine dehydrogenase [Chloroflexi bacterium]|jgi:glycine dehydrogenase subunit 1|nr:aminomethyl-transferring glycine dehydrogenase [Chloroflexota bacterium]MDP7197095.1 aminomethyl-transferring glycine dehydrogenase subunit GcvPA [SAR202 cluster bacterium]|tara:strand:+ start:562 stop:1881 length:1320 start_codon:yes stop_codon:yes gene_type:complete
MDNQYQSTYTPNTPKIKKEMLSDIGFDSYKDLFSDIPKKFRFPDLNLPSPTSELDLKNELSKIANKNSIPGEYSSFLGAGAYRHFIPSVVKQITSRSEFMTSYTPYQPEVSQGTLQAHFEFQSMVCELTDMEVANAGMYDGATSAAEAVLMACRINKKFKVEIVGAVSPLYIDVIKTLTQAIGIEISYNNIETILNDDDDEPACYVIQQPNFLGEISDIEQLKILSNKNNALLIAISEPMFLSMYQTPSHYNADIVVAEGQPFGVSLAYGGPYAGLFACKKNYVRQLPGRIVGETVDSNNKKGYVLTLQTREQHIKRERATSNICTSVGLIALMSTVYMALQGKKGLKYLSELCYHKSHYAAEKINNLPGFKVQTNNFFKEFTISSPIPIKELNEHLHKNKIIGGYDVSNFIENSMLLAITEMNSKEEIDNLITILSQV